MCHSLTRVSRLKSTGNLFEGPQTVIQWSQYTECCLQQHHYGSRRAEGLASVAAVVPLVDRLTAGWCSQDLHQRWHGKPAGSKAHSNARIVVTVLMVTVSWCSPVPVCMTLDYQVWEQTASSV
jgi:hypothetical protein